MAPSRAGPVAVPTLVIVSHTDIASSRAHRKLLDAIAGLPGVVVRHLEALYPDGRIDVAREQAAVLAATRIVFQFPFNWYSTPTLLKAWQDDVLAVGFAFGPGGTHLRGKQLQLVFTAGGTRESYRAGGHNLFEVTELLKPLEATAHFVGMTMLPPLVLYYVPNVPGIPVPDDADARIDAFCLRYCDLLAAPEAATAVTLP
jgi:glutathione-regulated potassium-efflux system ancillary protein KefG